MRPFNRDGLCPKCGEDGASFRWEAPGPGPDCMRRSCQACGYTWLEVPLDQVPEHPAANVAGGVRPRLTARQILDRMAE